jgi:hypothetical protein
MISANRIILFVKKPKTVADFYLKFFDLKVLETSENGKWIDLDAGGIRIGLHSASRSPKSSPSSKIVFYAKDVAKLRDKLISKGLNLSEIFELEDLKFCDGKDPEGNRFQISNRK